MRNRPEMGKSRSGADGLHEARQDLYVGLVSLLALIVGETRYALSEGTCVSPRAVG